MNWAVWILFAAALGACFGCEEPTKKEVTAAKELKLGELPADVPIPAETYQRVYRKAQREITKENASERLDAIEDAVEKEADDLP